MGWCRAAAVACAFAWASCSLLVDDASVPGEGNGVFSLPEEELTFDAADGFCAQRGQVLAVVETSTEVASALEFGRQGGTPGDRWAGVGGRSSGCAGALTDVVSTR